MKRDLDLIRNLLLQVESATNHDFDSNQSPWRAFSSPKTSSDVVQYHVRLLMERKFLYPNSTNIDGQNEDGTPIAKFLPDALTDGGHEFLESIRDPEVWKKTKEGANMVGSFGIDFIKDIAKGYLKVKLKKHTGIELDD